MASLIPALRQISPTAVPSSPCRRMKAICASVNFDLFMVLPRPTARIAHAAKLEFSSKIGPKTGKQVRERSHELNQRAKHRQIKFISAKLDESGFDAVDSAFDVRASPNSNLLYS